MMRGKLDGALSLLTRGASRVIGLAGEIPLPRASRQLIFRTYSVVYKTNLADARDPVDTYPTLTSFFLRHLRSGVRSFDQGDRALLSPADGCLSAMGQVRQGTLIQAKGLCYSVEALLDQDPRATAFEGGGFVTVHLRPGDYHRVHSPVTGSITGLNHVPGDLLPVAAWSSCRVRELYLRNERAIIWMEAMGRPVAMVMIGAFGVGHIRLVHDDLYEGPRRRTYTNPHRVRAGDEVGSFALGSTVVLLWPPNLAGGLLAHLEQGQPVMVGRALAPLVG